MAFSLVACNSNKDSAKKVKADYESFDWDKATPSAAVSKAQSLIARIDKLTATEQQELKEIKTKLESIVKNNNPSPSPSVSPSSSPSESPSSSASPSPSTSNSSY